MLLREWLEKHDVPQHEMGDRIGITQGAVSKGLERGFSREVSRKIVDVTGGEVTLEEALFPGDGKKNDSAA